MDSGDKFGQISLRARRRDQRLRMLERALRSVKFLDMTEAERKHWALRQHDHLASCSCWMCGNPRKFFGECTMQERRRLEAMDRDRLMSAWERE